MFVKTDSFFLYMILGAIIIAARNKQTCTVLNDGGIYCWGSNNNGQLGLGNASRGIQSFATPEYVGGLGSRKCTDTQ